MTMKAGASDHDKVRIAKLYGEGKYSLEQISATVRVRLEHVQAIVKQIEEGTMKLKGAPSYQSGEADGQEAVPEQKAAEKVREDDLLARLAAAEARAETAEAERDELLDEPGGDDENDEGAAEDDSEDDAA